MHKKAKITSTRFKGIPAVLTAQGFHKGRLDCVEVSVIHCLDGIVINASSREVFHRRRLALPSSSTLLNSSTLLSPPNNSSTKEEKQDKSRTQEKINKTEDKSKKQRRTKADTGDEKVEILIRDAFGTFKGEVPYYSARIMSIPLVEVPTLPELETAYENMCEERRKEEWIVKKEGEEE